MVAKKDASSFPQSCLRSLIRLKRLQPIKHVECAKQYQLTLAEERRARADQIADQVKSLI